MTYGIGIYEPIYSQYLRNAGRYTTNTNTNPTLSGVSTLPTNLNARDQIELCVSSSHFDKTAYKRYETMTDASADLVTYATSTKLLLSIIKENTASSQTYSWVFALNVMRVRG